MKPLQLPLGLFFGLVFVALAYSARAASTLVASGASAAAVEGNLALTWGNNSNSQLGHSAGQTYVIRPTLLAGSWSKVSMGGTFALGLANDGKLYGWGANQEGQLGNGTTSTQPSVAPTMVALPEGAQVLDFVAGQSHALALVNLPGEQGVVFAWGANTFGQLGQGVSDTSRRSTPVRVVIGSRARPLAVTKIAVTDLSCFAIAQDRTLWSWGGNLHGELGRGAKITVKNQSSGVPARVGSAKVWTDIVGGARHVLGLRGKQLAAWGDNSLGQCAQPQKRSYIVAPVLVALPVISKKVARVPVAVAAGTGHSLVMTETGEVLGFGLRLQGALGAFDPIRLEMFYNKATVLSMPGAVVQLAAGGDFSIFRFANGQVKAMGYNQYGQLGDGNSDVSAPVTNLVDTLLGSAALTVDTPPLVSNNQGVGTTIGPMALTVHNGGTAAQVNPYRVSLYLSSGETPDGSARLLATKVIVDDLAPAANKVIQFSSSELTLSNVAPGTYRVISQVVPLNALGEATDEYKPFSGVSIPLTMVGPDLTPDGVITLANTLISEATPKIASVSLSLRNVNLGIVPAGSSIVVEAFLSGDNILQASTDILLKRHEVIVPVSGLLPGEALSVILGDLDVSGQTPGGNYNLIVAVNREGGIAETGISTNFVYIPVRVAAHDLSVTAPLLPDGGVGFASTLARVTVNVKNQGELTYDSASGCTVELYLSNEPEFSFTASKIGSVSVTGALAAAAGRLVVFENITLPVTLTGQVYFHSRVVADPTLGDRFPANNTAATGVLLEDAVLSVTDFIFPNTTSVQSGGSFGAVTYRLNNSGLGWLPPGYPVAIEVFLSTGGSLDRNRDVLLDRYLYSGGVAPGASVLLPTTGRNLVVPVGIANGIYQLLVAVNKDNGQLNLPSVVVARPVSVGVIDAGVVGPALASPALGANTRVSTIGATVANRSGFPIPGGLAVELYLSRDNQFDNADLMLAATTLSDLLPAKNAYAITFSNVLVPDIGQGEFFLLARVVLPAGLVDVDYSDNIGATAVTISRADISVENFKTPPVVNVDQPAAVVAGVSFDLVNTSLGAIPANVSLSYELFLSRDAEYNPEDRLLLAPQPYQTNVGGVSVPGGARLPFGPMDVPLPDSLVGGSYYLLLVVNRNGDVLLASGQPVVVSRLVILEKENAAGAAFDYGVVGFSGAANWSFITDPRATDGTAMQSPPLEMGQTSTVSMRVTGPTSLPVPWNLIANNGDSVALLIDGVVQNVLGAFDSVYRLSGPGQTAVVVPEGLHTVEWTYTQTTANSAHYARLDLDLPSFTPSGDGDWFGVNSPEAKVGPSYARSPELGSGQQAALEVTVNGPAMVSFWWRAVGDENSDTLAFYIDGVLATIPTDSFDAVSRVAVISNQPEWRRVAFLIEGGPRQLRWVYTQGSDNLLAQGNLDGLVVSSPIPQTISLNRTNDASGEYVDVPGSTLDWAIREFSAPYGTYLLDDAGGSGRLQVRVSFANVGSAYAAQPAWSASDLQLRFSGDKVWGNGDDIILGNFARFEVRVAGGEVTFDVDVNLPLSLPSGTYRLMARIRNNGQQTEFTYSNNTAIRDGDYIIKRAPNLVVGNFDGLSSAYPYHPEDAVYVTYDLRNLGLGDLTPDQRFKVRVSLYALLDRTETDLTKGRLIRDFPDREFSLFLPAAQAAYPQGAFTDVVHFLDLPSMRDILVALGHVPAGTPEDAAPVTFNASKLMDALYFFRVVVDVDDQVAESSETNAFWIGQLFNIVPVPFTEDAGAFFGYAAFGDLFFDNPTIFENAEFSYTARPPSVGSFTRYVWDYALYRAPEGTPNLLFQQWEQNGLVPLMVPPASSSQDYQTVTFDFNVRANDVVIHVQATDDGVAGGVWETIQTLRPPYNQIFGPNSLNGYEGLASSPYVLAVEGNVTDVQKVYAARITVRDRLSVAARGAANQPRMRLVVEPRPGLVPPRAPLTLTASVVDAAIVLNWTESADAVPNSTYIIERSRDGITYRVLGSVVGRSFVDLAPGTAGRNSYRVRSLNAAGATGAVTTAITLP